MLRSSFPECRQIAGFKQTLEEKLGIPVKPKKPLTPFFRFMGQIRPMVVQQHPSARVTDHTKIIAQQWKKLEPPAKQKFEEEFKKEMIHYIAVRVSYENSLTDQQKMDLQKAKEKKVESKQQRQLKMKKKELGKPKKPITAFLMFFQEKAKLRGDIPFKMMFRINNHIISRDRTRSITSHFSTSLHTANHTGQHDSNKLCYNINAPNLLGMLANMLVLGEPIWQQKMSQEWESLPDEIKVQYLDKASQYWQSYLQELQLWEEKMIRLGHIDVVRNEALIEPRSNKIRELEIQEMCPRIQKLEIQETYPRIRELEIQEIFPKIEKLVPRNTKNMSQDKETENTKSVSHGAETGDTRILSSDIGTVNTKSVFKDTRNVNINVVQDSEIVETRHVLQRKGGVNSINIPHITRNMGQETENVNSRIQVLSKQRVNAVRQMESAPQDTELVNQAKGNTYQQTGRWKGRAKRKRATLSYRQKTQHKALQTTNSTQHDPHRASLTCALLSGTELKLAYMHVTAGQSSLRDNQQDNSMHDHLPGNIGVESSARGNFLASCFVSEEVSAQFNMPESQMDARHCTPAIESSVVEATEEQCSTCSSSSSDEEFLLLRLQEEEEKKRRLQKLLSIYFQGEVATCFALHRKVRSNALSTIRSRHCAVRTRPHGFFGAPSDSAQLTVDGFEKFPDQIMYPYTEPYDLQKHKTLLRTYTQCRILVTAGGERPQSSRATPIISASVLLDAVACKTRNVLVLVGTDKMVQVQLIWKNVPSVSSSAGGWLSPPGPVNLSKNCSNLESSWLGPSAESKECTCPFKLPTPFSPSNITLKSEYYNQVGYNTSLEKNFYSSDTSGGSCIGTAELQDPPIST
uniref:HMG box domain-containing protein n=1 Tax=Timema shepardi TaxID=629360 RepID=A0A7R9ASN6_TIMSH|nr:unnamed protein product [Timema shepardi]